MFAEPKHNAQLYFLGVFVAIFIISFFVFSFSGLAPRSISLYDYFFNKPPDIIGQPIVFQTGDGYIQSYTRPDRIVIPKIGVDSIIQQPNSPDVTVLDQALSKSAVHYPGSGSIEQGNIFIFGHSADLFTGVQNAAYKVFNNLSKLTVGDTIELIADGEVYTYKVTRLVLVDKDDALVRFDSERRTLTISTCNTFGAREERWVVEAELVW